MISDALHQYLLKIDSIMEKPGKQNAKSNLASVSSYIFNPEIFKYVREASQDIEAGQELSLQKAMQLMINDGKQIQAYKIVDGKYYDSGNKLEYMKTVIDFGLSDPNIGPALKTYLTTKL